MLTSGCGVISAIKPTIETNTGCQTFKVIRPSIQDTDDTKRQVLAHNEIYRLVCVN